MPKSIDTTIAQQLIVGGTETAIYRQSRQRRGQKSEALLVAMNLGQTRWLLYAQQENSSSMPLVVSVVFWLTINFISFGLFVPRNVTVIAHSFYVRLLCPAQAF